MKPTARDTGKKIILDQKSLSKPMFRFLGVSLKEYRGREIRMGHQHLEPSSTKWTGIIGATNAFFQR